MLSRNVRLGFLTFRLLDRLLTVIYGAILEAKTEYLKDACMLDFVFGFEFGFYYCARQPYGRYNTGVVSTIWQLMHVCECFHKIENCI